MEFTTSAVAGNRVIRLFYMGPSNLSFCAQTPDLVGCTTYQVIFARGATSLVTTDNHVVVGIGDIGVGDTCTISCDATGIDVADQFANIQIVSPMARRQYLTLPSGITPANIRSAEQAQGEIFPHMSKLDRKVWLRFLHGDHPPFLDLNYDVRVGSAEYATGEQAAQYDRMWEELIRKRIDVVAETKEEVWIVEVKPIANMSALGQVLSYSLLYEEERHPAKPIRRVVICQEIDRDMVKVYQAYDVTAYVVGSLSQDHASPERIV